MISTPERARALARARGQLHLIEQHPSASRANLGAARDQLNIAATWPDPSGVWDAIYALEEIVCILHRQRCPKPDHDLTCGYPGP